MQDVARDAVLVTNSTTPLSHNDNPAFPELILLAEEFARTTISSLPPGFSYHCVQHTQQVVENGRTIARAIDFPQHETDLLRLAAWLHDTGFRTIYFGHERESCIAARSLFANVLTEPDLRAIEGAILATKIPQRPTDPIAEILCDADLLYLGGDEFLLWSGRLREEHLLRLGRQYSEREWLEINLDFVRNQHFHTPFAREYSAPGLLKNIQMLERMKKELPDRRP